jgi:hypothetical protein
MSATFPLPMPPECEPAKLSARYCSPQLYAIQNTKMSQADSTATIDGTLNDDGLTVLLRSPDSGLTLREQVCVRFSPRELPTIGDVPNHTNRFCDISAGVSSEGRMLVIESHRCYMADSQGNASALKV